MVGKDYPRKHESVNPPRQLTDLFLLVLYMGFCACMILWYPFLHDCLLTSRETGLRITGRVSQVESVSALDVVTMVVSTPSIDSLDFLALTNVT